jgi:putative CocE/NonD family hydrolase
VVKSMDDFSPHSHQAAGDKAGVPILSLSGWRDGAYPHAAIRRWLNTASPVNRLVLGPWDHGGKNHITPGKERKLGTEIGSEAIKFFDHYLKGYNTGIDREPPVQYYVMQAEEWRGSASWPPAEAGSVSFYLQEGGRLENVAGNEGFAAVPLVHDTAQGTGHYTRWRGLRLSLGTGRLYPDRKHRDRLLACWDSEVLKRDMEVTGHCVVHLFIRTQEPDGSFFVYLEDITPGGEVWYVTEGELRAIHRRIGSGTPPYRDVVPYHSYLEADAEAIPAGEVVEVRFDLLPVAWLFRKGHRVRVAIATGDRDNFRQICREGSVYEVILGMSRVELAVRGV